MTWTGAWLRAFAILIYFFVATVWLPDFVLGLGPVTDASEFLRDLVLLAVWGGAFAGGLVVLRRGQKRGIV